MGKGRIISAHGEGRYTIEIVEDRARAESARALAVQRVSELDGRINDLDQQISAAQAAVNAAAADQDAAIEQYRLEMAETGESDIDLAEHARAVLDAAQARDSLRTQQRLLEVQRAAAQSRIDRIDALPPLRQIDAWCADYTEDLSGEVATAEVPGEIGQVIIKPGFEDGAAWSPSADGAIQPALAGTPASVFYNLAMMPGWQRWRPTFRIATISNIDNDLCDITLDPATSSQQGLPVNAQGSYTGVPIMYMDCNGAAFENGDRVLVAFSGSTEQPMVVGFEQEPRECFIDFTRNLLSGAMYNGDVVSDRWRVASSSTDGCQPMELLSPTSSIQHIGRTGYFYVPRSVIASERTASYGATSVLDQMTIELVEKSLSMSEVVSSVLWEMSCAFNYKGQSQRAFIKSRTRVVHHFVCKEYTSPTTFYEWASDGTYWNLVDNIVGYGGTYIYLTELGLFLPNTAVRFVPPDTWNDPTVGGSNLPTRVYFDEIACSFSAELVEGVLYVTVGFMVGEIDPPPIYIEDYWTVYASFATLPDGSAQRVRSRNQSSVLPDDGGYPATPPAP